MPRTVVYRRPVSAPAQSITFGGPGGHTASTSDTSSDGYSEKLAKYVPAEVLAFFTPMAAMVGDRPTLLTSAAILGALATPGYLWYSARRLDGEHQPLPHFYLLATLSFIAWAVTTSRLGVLLGLDQISSSFMLGAVIFVLPLIDALAAKLSGK